MKPKTPAEILCPPQQAAVMALINAAMKSDAAAEQLGMSRAALAEIFLVVNRRQELQVSLSPHQQIILMLIGAGLGDQQISEAMHCSEHTVKSQLHRIFEKLRVRTRGAAVFQFDRLPVSPKRVTPKRESACW